MIDGGSRATEEGTCYLCHARGEALYRNSRDQLFGTPGTWGQDRCPRCGLLWLTPRPGSGYAAALYDRYYTHTQPERRRFVAGMRRAINNAIATDFGYAPVTRRQRLLGWTLARLRPLASMSAMSAMYLDGHSKGRLLDVGCGSGHFLARMRDLGWEVLGIEPDARAAQVARDTYDVPVLVSTIESANLPSDHFDAVTMQHVIEHLTDPVEALRACYRVLKPGGRMAIATPNNRALGHRLLGRSWRELDPPRHFFLFSPATLLACAARAGFDGGIIHQSARYASEIWITSCVAARRPGAVVGPSARGSALLRLQGLLFRAIEEMALMAHYGGGEEMLLLTTKKG